MMRLCTAVLFALALLPALAAADQPAWSFDGVLPIIFEKFEPVPLAAYSDEGKVLTAAQIRKALEIGPGDPLILIRGGAVVATGAIGEIVAQTRADANQGRALYLRPVGLPDTIAVPAAPRGPAVLADAGYDLYVLTDKPVEVLAPDPLFNDIAWGVNDYCVRVGRLRFAVVREYAPGSKQFRGWQVIKLEDTGPLKVHADYTWQP